jgi:hypothetical protein
MGFSWRLTLAPRLSISIRRSCEDNISVTQRGSARGRQQEVSEEVPGVPPSVPPRLYTGESGLDCDHIFPI